MAYAKQTWNNDDSNTPLSAARLNHIEDGIFDTDAAIPTTAADLDAAEADHTHDIADITNVTAVGQSLATAATATDARTAIGAGTSNFSGSYDDLTDVPAAGGGEEFSETEIRFSSLTGADDDAKLLNGISIVQSAVLKGRTIYLDENRDYTFNDQVVIPSGFSLRGTMRPQDQPRSSRPVGNRILLRMSGASSGKGWLKIGTGSTFGVSVTNLSIDGDINSSFFDGSEDNGGVLWTAQFRDISIQNAKSVFGSKANRLLMTSVSRDGFWNINNVRETAWNDGGSDFYSQPTMMLVDSPSELLGFNEFLMMNSYMSNGFYSNVYCTAEAHSGLLIQGSNNTSQNLFYDRFILEGRNENHPSPGALVRMNQGQALISRTRFAFGMSDPSKITSRTDKGIIHVAGGNLTVESSTYERGYTTSAWVPPASPTTGAAVGEDVPFIYAAAGSKVRVRNIIPTGPTTGDRSWTGKPVVKQAVEGLIDADDSVILVTAETAAAPNAAGDTTTGHANTGTAVTINAPANVEDDDVLIAAVYSRAASAVYATPPTGWTAIEPSTDNTAAGVVRLYWKRITDAGSEPADYTWTGGGSGRHVGIITRVTGSVASPVDVASAAATGITGPERIICPTITTTTDLDMLVMVGTSNGTGGDAPEFTAPAGATVVASTQTTTGASESGITLAVETAVATGATGSRTLTVVGTSSTGVGYMAAIKSAG
jgi:hypothetical protein